jgi:hypothetical protein
VQDAPRSAHFAQNSDSGELGKPEWYADSIRDKKDGHFTNSLILSAAGYTGEALVIRCQHGKPDFFVRTADLVEADAGFGSGVVITIDDELPAQQRWLESADGKGLFSPKPLQILKLASKANKLVFEYWPRDHGPRAAEFELFGLNKKLNQIAPSCGLK